MARKNEVKATRKLITMDGVPTVETIGTPIITEKKHKDTFNIGEFLKLHEQFMTVKNLEGLAEKTIQDHLTFMRYLKNWVQSEVQEYENRIVEKGIFLEYIAYLF